MTTRQERQRVYQARYQRTEKGRATAARYRRTEKAREADRQRCRERYWQDPIAAAARVDNDRRAQRIARMETQLEELLDAS
jgi:hypothetical protein